MVKLLKLVPVVYYFDTTKSNKSPVNTYSLLSTGKDQNHILVDVKLKEHIELVPYKETIWPSVKDY